MIDRGIVRLPDILLRYGRSKYLRSNYIIANSEDYVFVSKFRFNYIHGVLRGSGHDKKAQKKVTKNIGRVTVN